MVPVPFLRRYLTPINVYVVRAARQLYTRDVTSNELYLYRKVLQKIWDCDNDPGTEVNPFVLLKTQDSIARLIRRVEKRHRKYRRFITPQNKKHYSQILNDDLTFCRVLGDTLAWYLIKPYTFRQHAKHDLPSPPQTRKKGFKGEMLALREICRDLKLFAIAHGLTNSLRIGDISIVFPEETAIVEVKNFSNTPKPKALDRLLKQIQRMENFQKLHGDASFLDPKELSETFKGYPKEFSLTRSEAPREKKQTYSGEIHFGLKISEELRKVSRDHKIRFVTFDNVIGYLLSSTKTKALKKAVQMGPKEIFKLYESFIKDSTGHFSIIDAFARPSDLTDIPPITRIVEPDIAAKIMTGELIVQTLICSSKLVEYLKRKDVIVQPDFLITKEYAIANSSARGFLFYPIKYIMFAFHSAEFLANSCLEMSAASQHMKERLLKENPGAEIIEFNSIEEALQYQKKDPQ